MAFLGFERVRRNFRSLWINGRINEQKQVYKGNASSQLRQMRAVGIVTQIGAYFFLASGVPGLGMSAMATLAMEHAAAAAATANIKSLLVLLFLSSTIFPFWESLEALTTTMTRQEVVAAAAEPPKN
ncbi:unnamed protein product [Fraxinus pennsylvanica]|uniref:Uncharacterized protein n=1 Tax=Fraxinus pennsylvanica TaxID=56036 RepID=A0AAD2ACV2_9LAMI|nr:unnamed protein product [Fraxinus pennsylvanica]